MHGNSISVIFECDMFIVLQFGVDEAFKQEYLVDDLVINYSEITDSTCEDIFDAIMSINPSDIMEQCLFLYQIKDNTHSEVKYNRNKGEIYFGRNLYRTLSVTFDLDSKTLDTLCGFISLKLFLTRLNYIVELISSYKIGNNPNWSSVASFYIDHIFRVYSIKCFCDKVYRQVIRQVKSCHDICCEKNGSTNFYNNRGIYFRLFVVAYLFPDIKSCIETEWRTENPEYNNFETKLFQRGYSSLNYTIGYDYVMRTMPFGHEMLSKLATGILDYDFDIHYGTFLDFYADSKPKLLIGFMQCFENVNETDLVFGNVFSYIREDFMPNLAGLHLASTQNKIDVYFIASLMWFIRHNAFVKSIIVTDKEIYKKGDITKVCYSGNVIIRGDFTFDSFFVDGFKYKELRMYEEAFDILVPFIRYSVCVVLMHGSESFAVLPDGEIDVNRIEVNLNSARTGISYRYVNC